MIQGHGNNVYEYEGLIQADFSSNIAFNHQADTICKYLATKLSVIQNYPDPQAVRLTEKLAAHHAVSPKQILVTNGSAELFYLLAHLRAGSRTLICTPAFAEYEDACRLYKHTLDFIPLNTFGEQTYQAYQTVWLANPNNPDGHVTALEQITVQCLQAPDTLFIVDEAYQSLCELQHTTSFASLPRNLLTVHSLTKSFAIPGLRLGYLIADAVWIEQLTAMRPPWSVNALALEAGDFILNQYDALLPDKDALMAASHYLQTELGKHPAIEVIPSCCNFMLCKLRTPQVAALKDYLIHQHGLLIRDASNFRGLDAHYFRVAAQSVEANKQLLAAIYEAMEVLKI